MEHEASQNEQVTSWTQYVWVGMGIIICLVLLTLYAYAIYATNPTLQADSEQSEWTTYVSETYGISFSLSPRWDSATVSEDSRGMSITIDNHIVCELLVSEEPGGIISPRNKDARQVQTQSYKEKMYTWYCDPDDYGVTGFELYTQAIDEGRLREISAGKVRGPFREFKEMVVPNLAFID